MPTPPLPRPVELIPAAPQRLWARRAVVNFVGGGLGAGFYVTAAVAARFGSSPVLTTASWLGPLFVLGGLLAVATEAGRPLRGWRVLRRVPTSWMSREVGLGVAFAVLAAGEFLTAGPGQRVLAALSAVGLVLAQGCMVRRAHGVTAWTVPVLPLVFLSSALVSGTGLFMLLEVAVGRAPSDRLLAAVLVLLIAHMLVWQTFLSWSHDRAFAHATRPLREGRTRTATVVGGYLAPTFLIAVALALPAVTAPAAGVGALLMIASQIDAKAALILEAGELRPITIPRLRATRRPA